MLIMRRNELKLLKTFYKNYEISLFTLFFIRTDYWNRLLKNMVQTHSIPSREKKNLRYII